MALLRKMVHTAPPTAALSLNHDHNNYELVVVGGADRG